MCTRVQTGSTSKHQQRQTDRQTAKQLQQLKPYRSHICSALWLSFWTRESNELLGRSEFELKYYVIKQDFARASEQGVMLRT